MIDVLIAWLVTHPLQGVAVLAGFSIVIGLVLIPSLHHVTDHGHPRC